MIIIEPQKIIDLIEKIVIDVRTELANDYDISGDYKAFSGLCYEATKKCRERLKCEIIWLYELDVDIRTVHGEQSHHPRIPSQKWAIQHTWMKVVLSGCTIYVDPTSSQFKDIYKDIPEYYISNKFPYWYYPDRKNPVFNGVTKYINKKIQFKWIIKIHDQKYTAHYEIIEILQFDVWGNISDFIRRFIYR